MRRCGAVLAVTLLAGLMPAASHASTIVGSPLTLAQGGSIGQADYVFVQTAFADPAGRLASPVDGTVVRWSLRGTNINADPNTFALRVLRPVGDGTFIGAGTSEVRSTPHTGSNDDIVRTFDTALPIRAGYHIGLGTVGAANVPWAASPGAGLEDFLPFADGVSSGSPNLLGGAQDHELLFNAEVVAAPTSSAVVPACAEDGRVVVGMATDPATGSRAVRFRIDGGAEQSAPAANNVASVTVPPGRHTLEYWGEDAVPQQEIQHHSAALQSGACSPGPTPHLQLGRVTVTPATWRLGSLLPRLSRRVPVGTTIAFTLSAPARATLVFSQAKPGRRVGRRCAAPSRRNRGRRRCTRFVRAGGLTFAAHAGLDKVRFQGRLSRTKKLKPGRYTLTITATPSAGQRSNVRTAGFTIVR